MPHKRTKSEGRWRRELRKKVISTGGFNSTRDRLCTSWREFSAITKMCMPLRSAWWKKWLAGCGESKLKVDFHVKQSRSEAKDFWASRLVSEKKKTSSFCCRLMKKIGGKRTWRNASIKNLMWLMQLGLFLWSWRKSKANKRKVQNSDVFISRMKGTKSERSWMKLFLRPSIHLRRSLHMRQRPVLNCILLDWNQNLNWALWQTHQTCFIPSQAVRPANPSLLRCFVCMSESHWLEYCLISLFVCLL